MAKMVQKDMTAGQQLPELVGGRIVPAGRNARVEVMLVCHRCEYQAAARCFLLLTAFSFATFAMVFISVISVISAISVISEPARATRLGALLFEADQTGRRTEARRGGNWEDKRRCARRTIPPAG